MRLLVADPAYVPEARYRRFISRAQLTGLLADHLYRGEPYLAMNAVVLDAGEAQALRRLSVLFASAFHKAGKALREDVPALIEMGFPWPAAELLAAEPPRIPLVGRLDFMQDDSGRWWLLEFNADTPSGIREATAVDQLVHCMLPRASQFSRPNLHLGLDLQTAFCRSVAARGSSPALGLLTDSGELEDLAQMAFTQKLVAEPLAGRGIETVLGDSTNLEAAADGVALCGRPITSLYRYVPFEFLYSTATFALIYDAVSARRLTLLNGLYGLLLQHKGVMAWLWRHRDDDRFTEQERMALNEHLPPTWQPHDIPQGISPSDLVMKQVFGREGEEVFFAEDLAPHELNAKMQNKTYIAQQRIDSPQFAAAIPASTGPHVVDGRLTVGSYVVSGRWAGFYTRFGEKIITARAKWVATFVDSRESQASTVPQRGRLRAG